MPNDSPYRALLPERVPNTNDSIANNDDHSYYSALLPERIKPKPKNIIERIVDRIKGPDMTQHNYETLVILNQDIIKDYMHNTGSTFEEAMKWAVKQDALNWDRLGAIPRNFIEKYKNKQALERDGIKRVN
jgi:tRNA uridine 5-carbamoylmethylation protein Kti12